MSYQHEARLNKIREAQEEKLRELVAIQRDQEVPLVDEDMRDAIDAAFDRVFGHERPWDENMDRR